MVLQCFTAKNVDVRLFLVYIYSMSDEIKKYIEVPGGIGEMRSKLYVLSNQCAKYDGFSSIPSFDGSLHPYSDIPFAYVYMRDGVPIGVLVCIFKACERCEIQSVVLPRFRMQGVFNSLVMEAFKVLSGFGFRKFWFRIPKESISGERESLPVIQALEHANARFFQSDLIYLFSRTLFQKASLSSGLMKMMQLKSRI